MMAAKRLPRGIYKCGRVYYSRIAGVDGQIVRKRLSDDLPTAVLIVKKMKRDIDLIRAGVLEPRAATYFKRLDDVRKKYIEHLRSGSVANNTIEIFESSWMQVVVKNRFEYISELTLDAVNRWARRRLETGDIRKQTINLYVGHFSRALDHASKIGLVRDNPLSLWTRVRQNEPRARRELSTEELASCFKQKKDFE